MKLNDIKLTRIIHPIGQGGFYSETLRCDDKEINVIYDCGGNNIITMQNYLECYYPNGCNKEIDAVFISHLHDDHINGLMYLLDNYGVKFLFLPQLDEEEKLEVLLYNILKNEGVPAYFEFLNLILNINQNKENEYKETKIIRVSHFDGDIPINTEINNSIDKNIKDELLNINEIKTGTKIHFEQKWLFIPYNPPVIGNNSKSFLDVFKEEIGLSDFKIKDLSNIVKKIGLDKCKKIYNKYFKNNHNAYSMTLFSGVAEPGCRFNHYCDYYEDICFCLPHRRNRKPWYSPNCLYTGDFDAKKQFKNLKSFYGPLWKTIDLIQVPHHGSRNNFCPLMFENAHHGFVSVGEGNRYHHPNVDTLIGIKQMHCDLSIITESLSSIKMYHYEI